MKTVQVSLDEELLEKVDQVVRQRGTTRSAFTRKALQEAINRYNIHQLELKHREGYKSNPVSKNEFSVWEDEQEWAIDETRRNTLVQI